MNWNFCGGAGSYPADYWRNCCLSLVPIVEDAIGKKFVLCWQLMVFTDSLFYLFLGLLLCMDEPSSIFLSILYSCISSPIFRLAESVVRLRFLSFSSELNFLRRYLTRLPIIVKKCNLDLSSATWSCRIVATSLVLSANILQVDTRLSSRSLIRVKNNYFFIPNPRRSQIE